MVELLKMALSAAILILRRQARSSGDRDDARSYRAELMELAAELQWEVSVSTALRDLHQPLISTDSRVEEMAQLVIEKASRLTRSTIAYLTAVTPNDDSRLTCIASINCSNSCQGPRQSVRCAIPGTNDGQVVGLLGRPLTDQPTLLNCPQQLPALGNRGIKRVERFLSVPVVLNGQPAGEIALANPPGDYTSRDLAALERLAQLYALALQRKITQQQVWAALREKEVLLREIHHRVKNNLQVISSLLSLQTRRLADAKVGEMFKESQNRVRSMAMIHEQLHRSTDLSRIDFAQYLRNLTASLFSSYGVDSSQIGLKLDIAEACLPIDLATPFGLIVHELVSNSLKHAFADGRQGEIRIAFRPLGDSDGGGRQWRLTVADDGPGLPTEVDPENSSSLGLRLVRILAEQLDGSVEYRRDPGSKFQITLSDQ